MIPAVSSDGSWECVWEVDILDGYYELSNVINGHHIYKSMCTVSCSRTSTLSGEKKPSNPQDDFLHSMFIPGQQYWR